MNRRFDEHLADVYGFLGYRLGSRSAAEELTRATFERGARNEPSGAGLDEVRLALLGIAHRLSGSREREPLGADGGDPAVSPALARALDRLPQIERTVLALRYGARLTGAEAARVLELSEARAQRSFSRALRRLRTELEGEERDPEQQAEA